MSLRRPQLESIECASRSCCGYVCQAVDPESIFNLLVQDDVMIDIAAIEKTDKVVRSIEFAGSVLDLTTAKSLVEEWGSLVKACLQ